MRIIAQLIDAKTDTHLWAEKYNGSLDDIFDIQERVSKSIADSLKIKLSNSEQEQLTNRNFKDPIIYDIYLKARYENWQFSGALLNKAEKLSNEGLNLAGDNELLYTELCHTNVQYVNNLLKDPNLYPELLSKADQYAKKL